MIFWVVWIGFGLAYEGWALWTHKDALTLTHVILSHVPRWILALALGWVVYHFLIEPIHLP